MDIVLRVNSREFVIDLLSHLNKMNISLSTPLHQSLNEDIKLKDYGYGMCGFWSNIENSVYIRIINNVIDGWNYYKENEKPYENLIFRYGIILLKII
jgi:hypothetical protein